MDIYYNTKDMKEKLAKELERIMAILTAWQKVTFPTKKDGTRFSVLSKNIEGAKLSLSDFAIQPGENVVTVYTHTPKNGYIHDYIYAYCMVKDFGATDPRKEKTQNYQTKQTYLNQVYTYDIDDIKQAIKTRIEYLQGQAADLKKEIAAADKAYNQFKKDYENAVAKLRKLSMFEHGNTELKNMILNSIQKNY